MSPIKSRRVAGPRRETVSRWIATRRSTSSGPPCATCSRARSEPPSLLHSQLTLWRKLSAPAWVDTTCASSLGPKLDGSSSKGIIPRQS